MKKYKAVLFDYDGTIMDTNKLICASWQHMFKEVLGHEVPEEKFLHSFGMPLVPALDKVVKELGVYDKDPEVLADIYRDFQKKNRDYYMGLFPGIKEMLKGLHDKGIKIGIVTSRGVESLKVGLKDFGIEEYFDAIVGAEDTDIHKPQPEPALLCCKKLGVEPKDAVMVGDSVLDLQCGHNAGCSACFVKWSFCTTLEKAEKEANPEFIISTPQELLDVL